jgi:hypothetical protein
VAVEIRAAANQKVQAFHKTRKERGVASQVTPRCNSERFSGKQDLSKKITLAGVMGMVSSDIWDRTVKLEGLSLNEATAPAAEDILEQEVVEAKEPTTELGADRERALSSTHGTSYSGTSTGLQFLLGMMERRIPSLFHTECRGKWLHNWDLPHWRIYRSSSGRRS